MGYYVTLTDWSWRLPAENLDKAYQALIALDHPDYNHLKNGGSWEKGGKRRWWFSWMPESLASLDSVASILEHAGFETALDDDGALLVEGYDSKTGNEELLLATIAPFVTDGSYMEWRGEDGAQWQLEFVKGQLLSRQAVITWDEGRPVAPPHRKPFARLQAEDAAKDVYRQAQAEAVRKRLDMEKAGVSEAGRNKVFAEATDAAAQELGRAMIEASKIV